MATTCSTDSLTKGAIFNMYKSLKESGENTIEGVNKKCAELFPSDYQKCDSNPKSVFTKVKKVYDEIAYANRSSKTLYADTKMSELFQFPKLTTNLERSLNHLTPRKRKLQEELLETKKVNKTLKRNLSKAMEQNESLKNDTEVLEDQYFNYISTMQKVINKANSVLFKKNCALKEVREEYEASNKQFSELTEKLDTVTVELLKSKEKLGKSSTRNLNKKLKRRDDTLQKQKELLTEQQSQMDKYANDLNSMEQNLNENKTEILDLKTEKRKLQKKISYLRIKLEKAKRERGGGNLLLEEEYLHEIDEMKQNVNVLQNENKELEELVSLLEGEEVVTFQNGKYTDEVRETVMELLSMNVSMNRVNDVIRTVLRNLASKDVDRLPSNALKSRLLVEAKFLAQKQVAETMMQGADPSSLTGNCLHGDGTSKYHRHFQSFQVTTLSGKTITIGLHEMGGSSTADVLKSFKDCVDELASTLEGSSVDAESKDANIAKLVSSIKNTMSDQGAVNPCFNRELEIIRKDALPKAVDNWDVLSEQARAEIISMGNFYCKMHLLVNFATECDKTLKVFESICDETRKTNESGYQTNESGAARLVRTAVKALHPHGSEEAGVASHFQAYLDGKNKKLKRVSYRGNRFNILFYDSAALYFHRDDVLDFLNHWPNPNMLLKAVHNDIKNKSFLAGVRALGIIDKIITGPLWRRIEAVESILKVNNDLFQLKLSLEEGCKDATELMQGNGPFPESIIHKDDLYEQLFGESGDEELDCLTQESLEILCHALLLILERQAADQLPGGKYWSEPGQPVSDKLQTQTSNVPTTNTVSERDFSVLDLLMRTKPNATVLAQEALTMWANNKTSEWLQNRSSTEKSDLLKEARENATKLKEKFETRKYEIKEKKMEMLRKKQENEENSKLKKTTKKVNYSNKMSETCGKVWSTESEVDVELSKILNEKEKRNSVISQINFHRYVLMSKGERSLCYLNKNKKAVPLEALVENLKEILRLNPISTDNTEVSDRCVKEAGQRKHEISIEKGKLAKKLREQRLKRIVHQQKSQLNLLLENPYNLVGKSFKHKCREEGSEEVFWCDGKVLGVFKDHQNTLKTEL